MSLPLKNRSLLTRTAWLMLLALLGMPLLAGCESNDSDPVEHHDFYSDGHRVSVTFLGERDSASLFGPEQTLLDQARPLGTDGQTEGEIYRSHPDWLDFEYRIDDRRRRLLVAKEPMMHSVSWLDIARAGAALDGEQLLRLRGRPYPQNTRVTDVDGNEYQLRLLQCGRSTHAPLSEWNLLIGGVHEGDMDFTGEEYGWIRQPYTDADLKVGLNGSLTWCQEDWSDPGRRVARGYYFVSRFHAASANTRTNRLFWRPVLELIEPPAPPAAVPDNAQTAPTGGLHYLGQKHHRELFTRSLGEQLDVSLGKTWQGGEPEWLSFDDDGTRKLVAAKPLAHSLSWNELARAGLVLGDGSELQVGSQRYAQDARVEDREGNRYRVRLLQCGGATLDHGAEWNRLMGAVVQPDGDFGAYPELYGWIDRPLPGAALNIGAMSGAASWCQERKNLYGKDHGINRGFLVPSRYHATDVDFRGSGFGWRPVLERIPD